MYTLPLQITSTNVGPERKLSVPGLFRIFQDAAIADAEQIGYNAAKTLSKGLLWVFSRVYVRFHAMPDYLSHATFSTYAGGKKAFLFTRYGKLVDEKGVTRAELSSIWALIHEDTRKLEPRPEFESIDESDGSEISLPGKIVPKPCTLKARRLIDYSDIDLNGHLNNVRYVEILMNLHPASFYQDHQLTELLIQYESEIHEGEMVEVLADDEFTYARGVVGDRVCFEANLSYGLAK